jgi:signal transduction histidine kinase
MAGGGVLRVSTEQANGLVKVTVSDTGKGIDATSLGRIFEPFFSTREGGTGLGLSLTQQIVSEHGGRITCESNLGQGTSFNIELPAYRAEDEKGDG